ncbi:hypothetical protein [Hymenobacter negativus]|uniref:Phage tail assembly protein n=1 Tax=Hymenobacter negativus TaxID=2795026 RepID=A0ABS0Q8K9_9BACT|nr:hypothetical protein [Hymenobacter negativus]MBH8558995.1 hypothetical protein [Hymenobacter negativus]
MKSTPSSLAPLTADATRGEVLLTIGGRQRLIRFGLKFLKALTEQRGGNGPTDVLETLEKAPLAALLDMATLAITLCVPAAELPEDFDALQAMDELPAAEQTQLFSVLLASVSANPLMAALTQTKAA